MDPGAKTHVVTPPHVRGAPRHASTYRASRCNRTRSPLALYWKGVRKMLGLTRREMDKQRTIAVKKRG